MREAGHAGTEADPWVKHRNGVPWHRAPLPRRLHVCRPQTIEQWDVIRRGRLDARIVRMGRFRCACGGKIDDQGRTGRNSRRSVLHAAQSTTA